MKNTKYKLDFKSSRQYRIDEDLSFPREVSEERLENLGWRLLTNEDSDRLIKETIDFFVPPRQYKAVSKSMIIKNLKQRLSTDDYILLTKAKDRKTHEPIEGMVGIYRKSRGSV